MPLLLAEIIFEPVEDLLPGMLICTVPTVSVEKDFLVLAGEQAPDYFNGAWDDLRAIHQRAIDVEDEVVEGIEDRIKVRQIILWLRHSIN